MVVVLLCCQWLASPTPPGLPRAGAAGSKALGWSGGGGKACGQYDPAHVSGLAGRHLAFPTPLGGRVHLLQKLCV